MIKKLIEKELEAANKKFPLFQSRHEAYGVLLEELEELKANIEDIECGIKKDYWKLCKDLKNKNQVSKGLVEKGYYSIYGDKEAEKLLVNLEISIEWGFTELIQLGAMIKKAKILEKEKEDL